jgi:methionyl-tRNA formyltransferase
VSAAPPIFLFCNLRYGAAVLDGLARSSGARPRILVLSERKTPRGVAALRAAWRRQRLRWRTGMDVWSVADVNAPAFLSRIPAGADGLVAGFNQIFKPAAIERFASLVNVHPSLLPFYRGPTPSHWVLERGERATGFSLHRVEVLAQGVVEVEGARDAADLDARIARAAAPVARRWLEHLESGAAWSSERVDASSIYLHPVDYLSFPS